MTPEEKNQIMLQRKRKELLERAKATPTASPTHEERLVSDGVKENLKAASHWVGVISKRTAELAQNGVAAAAEKAKEVKATVDAKRARSAEGRVQATEAESGPTVQPTQAEMAAEDLVDAFSVHEQAAIAGEGEAPLANSTQQVVADALSVQSESDSLLLDVANDLSAGDARVTKARWGAVVNTKGLPPQEAQELIQSVKDAFYDELAGRATGADEEADEVFEVDEASTAPSIFTETAETFSPVPEGANPPPEAASVEQPVTPSQPSSPSRWPWVLAGVVAAALVVGTIYFLHGKGDQVPPSTPQPVAPVATPAAPEQLPEVVEAPVVPPTPAVLPEQDEPEPAIEMPEPVATPDVTASAPIASQPKPSPKRATAPLPRKTPAPAADPGNDWRQNANADLDAWAKKSGID
ncbi:hypothetical protein [Stenotrophomonas maltophilia]|uniref:hypothetical protein n=1 Tax=Stenotrophomonas maltophilia TaxID=40324 RepID=UPI00066B9B99|nr:hypothetical protein [Stenotrophomonas maltophilia]